MSSLAGRLIIMYLAFSAPVNCFLFFPHNIQILEKPLKRLYTPHVSNTAIGV